jgi:hypothetical protein
MIRPEAMSKAANNEVVRVACIHELRRAALISTRVVENDRRIGTAGPALPTKGNRPPGAQPDGQREAKNPDTYQGLEALTQQAVHRPESSDVDDSSCLAQWRLASPEPRVR